MLKRYSAAIAGVLIALAASYFYGHKRGQDAIKIQLASANETHTNQMLIKQKEWEKQLYDLHQEAITKDAVFDSLSSSVNSLQQTIRNQRAELSDSAANLFAAQNRTSDVLSACVAEYQQMAKDADGVVEALRAGQKWHTIYIIK